MGQSRVRLGVVWSVIMLVACGAEPAAEPRSDVEVAAPVSTQPVAMQSARACGLLTLEAATRVIGPGTEHPGGDTEELTCIYSNPGVALLTLRLGRAAEYDQLTIMPPHTAAQIGSRGRYNVQETGAAAVQFVKGAYSVTLSVQPIGRSQSEYIEPLLTAAREAADRLP